MKDLFETEIPNILLPLFETYWEIDFADYLDTKQLLEQVEQLGYTFDYYLDNEPFGLRVLGIELNELDGFEE